MGKNGKSKWPRVPDNYESLPTNKQLHLTQNTSETILNYLLNGPNASPRESVPRAVAEAMLRMVASVTAKAIDQPDNRELLAAMQRLEQPIMRIEGDVTAMKHSKTTVTANTRPGPMGVWAKGLSAASPPIPQSTMTSCSTQPAPVPGSEAKTERQVTIKIRDNDTKERHRQQTPKDLQAFIETRFRAYPTLMTADIEVATQLKSGDIRLLMKTRGGAETLKNAKDAKEWVACFGKDAFVLIPTFGVVVHNVSTRIYQFPRDAESLAKTIVTANAHRIQDADIRYIGWLDKNKVKNPSVSSSAIVVEFTEAHHANIAWRAGLSWPSARGNEHHDCEKYVRESRIIRCFRCQKPGHITSACDSKTPVCVYCAQGHDSRECGEHEKPGFQPKCANCQGPHEAHSPKCERIKTIAQGAAERRRGPQTAYPESKSHSSAEITQSAKGTQQVTPQTTETTVKPAKARQSRARRVPKEGEISTAKPVNNTSPASDSNAVQVSTRQPAGSTNSISVVPSSQPAEQTRSEFLFRQQIPRNRKQNTNTNTSANPGAEASCPRVTLLHSPQGENRLVELGKRKTTARSPLTSPSKDRTRRRRASEWMPERTPLGTLSGAPTLANIPEMAPLEAPNFETLFPNGRETNAEGTDTTEASTQNADKENLPSAQRSKPSKATEKPTGSIFREEPLGIETPAQRRARKSYAASLAGTDSTPGPISEETSSLETTQSTAGVPTGDHRVTRSISKATESQESDTTS